MDGYIERQTLQDIADAIREKNGSSETYTPSEMAEAILDLSGNINLQDKQVTITENGTQTITADEGYEGLNSVEVVSGVASESYYESLVPFGFSNDIALMEDSIMFGNLKFTKEHIKDYMTLEEMTETKSKMIFYKSVEVLPYASDNKNLNEVLQLKSIERIVMKNDSINSLCKGCRNLEYVNEIVGLNKPTSLSYGFQNCVKLKTLAGFPSGLAAGQSSPTLLLNNCVALENFGGIDNMTFTLSLNASPKLTPQSVANIMKKAGQNTANRYLALHATAKNNFLAECETNTEFMEIYNEFINIKGWTIR